MPDRLYFTDSDEANELIATDPMALLDRVRARSAGDRPEGLHGTARAARAARLARPRHARLDRPRAGVPRETGGPPLPRRKWPSASTNSPSTCATTTTATPRACGQDATNADAAARQHRRPPRLRRDEGQGARRRARQALRRRRPRRASCRRTRRSATSTPRRRSSDYQAAKKAHKAEWSKMKSGG